MNNKKIVIALLLIAIIGIVGLTIAYFANSTSLDNTFTTKEYGTTYEETFVSPDNWLPGDTTEKTLVATNTGEVDQAVRVLVTESWTTNNNGTLNGWIHADGTKSTHTTQSELETDERVAILNLANTSDWTKVGNYYYYNYKLAPTESTSSLLESVTFNPKTKLDDTCTTTTNNGVTTTTCNSSGDDYDNATYTLTLTIETVQYNKYATAWNTNVEIAEVKPVDPYSMESMCPNCIFFTGFQLLNEELDESNDYTNDYSSLGDAFAGVITDNNIVTRVFLCGAMNNRYFCLEGDSDNLLISKNIDIVKHFFDWDNQCTGDEEYSIDCTDESEINVSLNQNGDIYIYSSENTQCFSYGNGIYYGSGC